MRYHREWRHKIEETRQTVIMSCSLSDDTSLVYKGISERYESRQLDSLTVLHFLSLFSKEEVFVGGYRKGKADTDKFRFIRRDMVAFLYIGIDRRSVDSIEISLGLSNTIQRPLNSQCSMRICRGIYHMIEIKIHRTRYRRFQIYISWGQVVFDLRLCSSRLLNGWKGHKSNRGCPIDHEIRTFSMSQIQDKDSRSY